MFLVFFFWAVFCIITTTCLFVMKSKGFLLLFMVRYRNMLERGIIEVSIADGE